MDSGESSMARREEGSGVRGGDSSREDSQGTEAIHVDPSVYSSALKQEDALQHDVTHAGTSDDRSHIWISSIEELNNAIKLSSLPQVEEIYVVQEDIGSGFVLLAEALASGEMSALQTLTLRQSGLADNRSEAISNALTSGKFPSLTYIDFGGNHIGTKGVEALGRAIGSGNLKTLTRLALQTTHMDDTDMATLAKAFRQEDASVLPNLRRMYLSSNSFSEVGLQCLAEALKSGRLDSLEYIDVRVCPKVRYEGGANILLSALTLNNLLTVEIDFEWDMFPTLNRRQQQLRMRNIRQKEIVTGLLGFPKVPASFGKVYLCGNPRVGKTTLSRTLQRTFFESLWTRETRPHVVRRTRGIDVSQFSSKGTNCLPYWRCAKQTKNPITLLVWDMAGQQDYHLVHHSFFPDLSFSEAKATLFVIVCSSEDLDESENQLKYWLRYIASSCDKTIRNLRHVFVILNNIGGDHRVRGRAERWEQVLQGARDKFKGLLEVQTDPFYVDVRKRRNVLLLKKCLLAQSSDFLQHENVPELCQVIQGYLPTWSETRKQFPVARWDEFLQDVKQLNAPWSEEIIEAATKYLNEVGVLIHIDKRFPPEWGIPYQRLVILDPNWFCREVVGNMFLTPDMVNQGEGNHLFREEVDEITGSIFISDFKKFFKSLRGEWSESQFEDLITILLWLGLCYKGRNENVFIPALIEKNGEPGDPWKPQNLRDHSEDQWVMGFSVERKESEMTLAPMSLWHRFQVELAQTPKFNGGVLDNDFTAGKTFMTFMVDYMNVQVIVDAKEEIPTFDKISIFVKPVPQDDVEGDSRKQRQVDLANDLLEKLLELWDTVCPTVEYLCRVIWPWPASQDRPIDNPRKNLEVTEVKKWVQENGPGRRMHWTVGSRSLIRQDQLLSTNDKETVIKALQSDISLLEEAMREATHLRIYPPELTEQSELALHGSGVPTQPTNLSINGVFYEKLGVAADGIEEPSQPMSPTGKIIEAVTREVRKAKMEVVDEVGKVGDKVDKAAKQLKDFENKLQEGLNVQKKVFRKVQDTHRFFQEDKDRTCPNLIYLGEKDTGGWATLKKSLSPSLHVRLHFACEAEYNNYRPHEVKKQQGMDVSALKPSLRKIIPWLKVSLTVLLISAKIGGNFVAPGLGLILPNFQQWRQATPLLDGIVWATGFAKEELDKLMLEDMGLDVNDHLWNPRDVYGKSREAFTGLIGTLTHETYEEKFGLRKVSLAYNDGSLHGVVWICTECLKKFRDSGLVCELS